MTFEEAITCLKNGERIKRSNWKSSYLCIIQKRIKMRQGFRKPWCYTFKDFDIFADDWKISVAHLFYEDEEENKAG